MQEIGRFLSHGRRLEDRSLVVSQHFEPVRNVVRVVRSRCESDLQVGAQERCAEFGDQFLAGVIRCSLTNLAVSFS